MKIGFVINDIATEKPGYTTIRLGQAAQALGHEAWFINVGDLAFDPDDSVRARARTAPKSSIKTGESYLRALRAPNARVERLVVDELDVLMLRNDPAEDAVARPWAASAGILFGRLAVSRGVIVLNDPDGLAKAMSKMYFQTFPEEVRPLTLVTRDRDDIKAFAREQKTIVIKPLQGSGGRNVFLVRPEDMSNLNQMIDAVSRDGFVVAQEYLPKAADGDVRLLLMNGSPLRYKGKIAAFRRVRAADDMRSNLHAGGTLASAEVDETMLHVAEIVRPKLVLDGMFFVGLDIVGDKLMEINVFSPGGLGSARRFAQVSFSHALIRALERKVESMRYYKRNFDNAEMATL